MSSAVAFAFASGASAVAAAWELVALVEGARLPARVRRLAAPLRAAGAVGRSPTADERSRLAAVFGLTLLAAGWLLGGPWLGLACATGGPWAVRRVLSARRRRWQRALAAGAPYVARSLADALAGGHAIRGALIEIARAGGGGAVVDAELRAAASSLALGERTEIVLERLRDRGGAAGWETVAAAVLLQRASGGDLAGLLRTIAVDLEAAGRAEADAHAVTAQARFTARLVCGLPLAAAVLAELALPGVVRETASGAVGIGLCVTAAVLQGVALLAVRQLARLERP